MTLPTSPTKGAEYALLQKLASTTKIPKEEFVRETLPAPDGDPPIYSYPVLGERFRGFDPLFYSVVLARNNLDLNQLLDPRKWLKSPIREAYYNGLAFLNRPGQQGRYVMSVQLTGMVWVVTTQPGYTTSRGTTFMGGILVRDPESNGVFISQPVKNYLSETIGLFEQE